MFYKFTQPCTGCGAHVDYTEAILRDVLCRGLYDTEVQMDLLGDNNQDMTSEQMLRFIEAKEAGKRSASRMLLPQATDALTSSSYKKQKTLSWGPTTKGSGCLHIRGNRGYVRATETTPSDSACDKAGNK